MILSSCPQITPGPPSWPTVRNAQQTQALRPCHRGAALSNCRKQGLWLSYDLTLPGELLQAASSRPELQALTGLPPSGPPTSSPTYTKSLSHSFTFPRAPSSRNGLLLSLAPFLYLVRLACPSFLSPQPVLPPALFWLPLPRVCLAIYSHYHLAPSCSTPLSSPTSGATAGSHQDGKA